MDYSNYNETVHTWIEEVQKNRGVNAELVLQYCADIEEYALDNNDVTLLGFACYYSGETYYLLNDGEKLFRYITRAISYLDASEQWDLVAKAYNIMGITSLNRGNAPIAMDYYLTGLNYCKKYGISQQENIINLNVGTVYLGIGQVNEAQKYFERVKAYVEQHQEIEDYPNFMTCIYANLGRCYLKKGLLDKAQECLEIIDKKYWSELRKAEQIYVLCFKARFYFTAGKYSMCEECVDAIHKQMDTNLPVMDIFDDIYDFGELLLDMDRDNVFWNIVELLEKMTKNAKIINLQRKIVSLKIKWYRKKYDDESYLRMAGIYYELTEIMERENQYMIANTLDVRNSLERENQRRRAAEEANERLQKKSETDPLTHLANRFRLNDYSAEAFERAARNGSTLAVEILDIDYFKEYNDNYGHQAGDECILAIAGELQKIQSERIFCARYGGDEFIVIYEGMLETEVFAMAEKLRENIIQLNMEHAYSKALKVTTVSQGICFDMPESGKKSWDFLHVADEMLYQVKRQSRNNIVMGNLRKIIIKRGTPIALETNS